MTPGSDAFSSHLRRTWSPCLDHGSLMEPSSPTHAYGTEDLNRGICLFLGAGKSGNRLGEKTGGKQFFFLGGIWQDVFTPQEEVQRSGFRLVGLLVPGCPNFFSLDNTPAAKICSGSCFPAFVTKNTLGVMSCSSFASGNVGTACTKRRPCQGSALPGSSLDSLRGLQGEGMRVLD